MLSDQEKLELREMAQSATMREEFRMLRRNLQQLERRITVDELVRWLSAMARVLPHPAKPRRLVEYKNVKF
jgi:hypothetical protein